MRHSEARYIYSRRRAAARIKRHIVADRGVLEDCFRLELFEVHDVEDTLLPGRRGSAEAVQTRERNRRKDLIFVWVSTGQGLKQVVEWSSRLRCF